MFGEDSGDDNDDDEEEEPRTIVEEGRVNTPSKNWLWAAVQRATSPLFQAAALASRSFLSLFLSSRPSPPRVINVINHLSSPPSQEADLGLFLSALGAQAQDMFSPPRKG